MARNISSLIDMQAEALELLAAGPMTYAEFETLARQNDLSEVMAYLRNMKRNGQIKMWVEYDQESGQISHMISLPS
jgi:hypothetical protein